MTARQSLARTAGFAALYVLATYAGRLTIMDGTNLSLVWPAAGVGAIWFLVQFSSRWRVLDMAAMAAATLVINMATGATAALAGFFVLANLVQAGVFAYLFRRWLPGLWGSGGTGNVARPQHLWRLVAVAVISTLAGALIGPTAVWITTGHYSVPAAAVWMARNSASMLLIGIAGLRLGAICHRYLTGPQALGWAALRGTWHAPRRTLVEAAALLVVSATAYLGIFGFTNRLPLAFVLVTITVWAATRMNTTFVIVHDLCFGAVAVIFTLHGTGQFAAIESNATRALISQLFVAVVAVVGLAVALGRDERVALQQQAAGQAELLTVIIDAMTEGLAVVDADGNLIVRNPAGARLMGGVTSSSGRMGDTGFYGLRHLDGTAIADGDLPYQRALATGLHHAQDMVVRNPGVPGGRTLSVRATPLPIEINGRRYAVSVFSDVTAERRHREELAAFAGVIAHDLSNPLATIEGWSEEVAEVLGPDAGRAGDGVARIRRAAGRMRDLITDLLSYTTARDSPLRLTTVDLNAMATDIAVARTDYAETTGAPTPRIHVGDLAPVHADQALVRQLLENLVGNAVKYTAPGVTPELSITAERQAGDVRVAISDNGIGIPDGQHEAVFMNFHRAHRNAGYSGTGLGLAICQHIVDRHGGTISARPNPAGAGTTVAFTLPAADLPAGGPPAARYASARR